MTDDPAVREAAVAYFDALFGEGAFESQSDSGDARIKAMRKGISAFLAHASVRELGSALEWYAEKATAAHRYLADPKKADAAVALIHELSIDNGARAKAALAVLAAGVRETR